MIRKILISLLTITILSGCGNNEKSQENALLDSVKSAHDKVMADDVPTMAARRRLKTLLAKPELQNSVNYFLKKLNDNDNLMMDWMNSSTLILQVNRTHRS